MSKMLDEIREQPDTLERTLSGEWQAVADLKSRLAKRKPKMVLLAARGTSDNAAQFGRYLLEITTGIPVSLAAPSVYTLYHASIDLRDVLVIAISQSGESTDTNLVLETAKQQGVFTIGVTNEQGSTLARIADCVLLVRAGKEQSVAATKTYTGQMLMLYLIAHALGADLSYDQLAQVPVWAADALRLEQEVELRAERYRFMDHAVVIGRGLNYSNAFEFALKLMETCYVIAERFSSADLLHGPIAMVEAGFPAFLFAPTGVTWPGIRDMLAKLNQLQAESFVITDRSNEEAGGARRGVTVPAQIPEMFTPIPYIIPAQLFAASL
ncbi:MAG: SIS domain-containing protein, partial [Acidobacteriaceae bacterium]|nr:SIS domain-containing protein [Acidobacteriaceae bacterium]